MITSGFDELDFLKVNSFIVNKFGFFEFSDIQLNLHETDLLFRYLSHHLTWQCSSISENLDRFARNLQHNNAKLFCY